MNNKYKAPAKLVDILKIAWHIPNSDYVKVVDASEDSELKFALTNLNNLADNNLAELDGLALHDFASRYNEACDFVKKNPLGKIKSKMYREVYADSQSYIHKLIDLQNLAKEVKSYNPQNINLTDHYCKIIDQENGDIMGFAFSPSNNLSQACLNKVQQYLTKWNEIARSDLKGTITGYFAWQTVDNIFRPFIVTDQFWSLYSASPSCSIIQLSQLPLTLVRSS